MNKLLEIIKSNSGLTTSVIDCEKEITPILQQYITNFPDYTDHSINHSKTVLGYAELILQDELNKLNEDEIYILIMAGLLHDIGMCPTKKMKERILESDVFISSNKSFEEYLRSIHHELSYEFITEHWEKLGIINDVYAHAIGLVCKGHRVVNLLDFEEYNTEYIVKSGTEYVCLPFLASVIRLADELDITNDRTPELLYNEYLPKNEISKLEWNKHKANYFVTFNKQTIKVTAKCTNKDLYYALLKHYNKIEDVIKYTQKVINYIPLNERSLKINFLKLERDIQPIGFIPKNIGFSFDLQNTINTFIGTNIYDNKFVAIRECLQNAIDSCRYKQITSKASYKPEINIIIKDSQLIIEDNGVGMDEFIVENYFSKLSKSYYQERTISKSFESISQFGVGVFSYFLLCDTFDVETKQEAKESLRFRVTKSAESYFYFFDKEHLRKTPGTTITFNLMSKLEFKELYNQVKYYIRFLEFPVNLFYNETKREVISESFEIDKVKLLERQVEREYREVLNELITIDCELNNDECEGILGLLFGKEGEIYMPIKQYDTLKTYSTSQIEISQKGIFIGNFSSRKVKNLLGKINLKHKNDLDLGRYRIKNDSYLDNIYETFYKNIIKKVFQNWENIELSRRYELNREFIGNYFEYHELYANEIIDIFDDNLIIKLFDGNEIKYLTIKETFAYSELIILRKETPFDSNRHYKDIDYDKIYEQVKCPMIIETWAPPAAFILNIFKTRKSDICVICSDSHWFFKISPMKQQNNVLFHNYGLGSRVTEALLFDKPHICAYTNLSIETPLNQDNDIVKYYIENIWEHQRGSESDVLYQDFFKELSRLFSNFHFYPEKNKNTYKEIEYLNSLLNKVNNIRGTRFKLSKDDFPKWMSDVIWNGK